MSKYRNKVRDLSEGRRALRTLIEQHKADDALLAADYRVDLLLTKSPKKKVLVAGIFTYVENKISAEEYRDRMDQGLPVQAGAEYVISKEPIRIRDPEQVRRHEILTALWREVDNCGGKTSLRFVVPALKIAVERSMLDVNNNRQDVQDAVLHAYKLAEELFAEGFTWDRQKREVARRRGRPVFSTATSLD